LPFRLELALSHPLQQLATAGSTYALQVLGFSAFSEGNVIVINQSRVGVVTACNGLGMLLLFFALSTAAAVLIRRPWPDRLVVLLSAVPIALLANVFRITVTSVLMEGLGLKGWGDLILHDLAGWFMMPVALGLLLLELRVLSWLFIEVSEADLPPPDFGQSFDESFVPVGA